MAISKTGSSTINHDMDNDPPGATGGKTTSVGGGLSNDRFDVAHHGYLREVQLGDHSYDLDTLEGQKSFEAEVKRMGGHISGVTVVASDGTVYNLMDPHSKAQIRQDSSDGKLNGAAKVESGMQEKPAETKPPGTPSSSEGTPPPATTEPPKGPTAGQTEDAAVIERAKAMVQGMGAEKLAQMVANGELPADMMQSQAAMLMINQRLQQYQQMITMMSNMMKIMHDLRMAIVNNMR
jgi:hypothetical protein